MDTTRIWPKQAKPRSSRMFDLLKSVYGFVCLDNKQRLLMLTERHYKHNHRCDLCGVYACHHEMEGHNRRHNRLPLTDCAHTVQLGENIGSVMNAMQITEKRDSERRFPIRKSESEGMKNDLPSSTPVSATEMKVPIEPLSVPIKVEGPNVPLEEKTSVKRIVLDEFIRCGICEGNIHWEFLTEHHKWHVFDFQPDKKYAPSASTSTSTRHTQTAFGHMANATALARTNTSSSSSTSTSVHTTSTNRKTPKTTAVSTVKPRSFVQYKFRPIDGMAAFSSTSKDGRFSDISLVAWLPERTRIESHGYAGGGYAATKDFERFVMTITHDIQDDYYIIGSKIVKRGQYSTYEFDELLVADRICTQEELLTETKRIILFYGLSPRAFYKRFRKLFKQNLIVESKNGRLVARTESSNALNDRLNGKSTPTPQKDESSDNDKFHCCG